MNRQLLKQVRGTYWVSTMVLAGLYYMFNGVEELWTEFFAILTIAGLIATIHGLIIGIKKERPKKHVVSNNSLTPEEAPSHKQAKKSHFSQQANSTGNEKAPLHDRYNNEAITSWQASGIAVLTVGIPYILLEFLDIFEFKIGIFLPIVVVVGGTIWAYSSYLYDRKQLQIIWERLDEGVDRDIEQIGDEFQDLVTTDGAEIFNEITELELEYFSTDEDDEYDLEEFYFGMWDEKTFHSNETFLEMVHFMEQQDWMTVQPNPNHAFFDERCPLKPPQGVLTYQKDSKHYIFLEHNSIDLKSLETKCVIRIMASIILPNHHNSLRLTPQEKHKSKSPSTTVGMPRLKNYNIEDLDAKSKDPFIPIEILLLMDQMSFDSIVIYKNTITFQCKPYQPVQQAKFLVKYLPKILSLYPTE